MRSINDYGSTYHVSALRRPNKNPSEASIREVKHIWYRIMQNKKVPPSIGDYVLVWFYETRNILSTSYKYLDGGTPLEMMTGDTPDISKYLDFIFYK